MKVRIRSFGSGDIGFGEQDTRLESSPPFNNSQGGVHKLRWKDEVCRFSLTTVKEFFHKVQQG